MKALSASALSAACGLAVIGAGITPLEATGISERVVTISERFAGGVSERLVGGNENPPVVSDGTGRFQWLARGNSIAFTLRYQVSDVAQAHIHIANPGNNGGIAVFLCTNLGNTPAGATHRDCPPAPAVVSGEIVATDVREVLHENTTLVLMAEDLEGLIRLMRQGATYANVHTVAHPGGEIRGQVNPRLR